MRLLFIALIFMASMAQAANISLTLDTDPSIPCNGFKVYYTDGATQWSQLIGMNTEYTLENLDPSTTYEIYATAFNEVRESVPSNTISVTTDAFVMSDEPKAELTIILPITIMVGQ